MSLNSENFGYRVVGTELISTAAILADFAGKDLEGTRQSKRIHKTPRWQAAYDHTDDLLPDSPPLRV